MIATIFSYTSSPAGRGAYASSPPSLCRACGIACIISSRTARRANPSAATASRPPATSKSPALMGEHGAQAAARRRLYSLASHEQPGARVSQGPLAFLCAGPSGGKRGRGAGSDRQRGGALRAGGARAASAGVNPPPFFSYVVFAFRLGPGCFGCSVVAPGLGGSASAGLAVCAGRGASSGGRSARRSERCVHGGAGLWL